MTQKMRELKTQMQEKVQAAKALRDAGELEKAITAMGEYDELQKGYQLEEQVQQAQKQLVPDAPSKEQKEKMSAEKAFAQAAREGFPKSKAATSMNEGSKEDGGYTVPEDIVTRVEQLRESGDALRSLVRVESVNTLSGGRTFKKRSQQTGFAKVSEGGKITQKESPQFTRLTYSVDKYAGYLPVTNELLEDSDENISSTVITWLGNEGRVTDNKLILEAVSGKTKTAITNLDDIKKILNVTLPSVFRATSKIITNQDGLQYLDTLKDNDGRYLLQPMVTDPTRYVLFGCEVVVLGNDTLASDTATAGKRGIPVILGDLKEGVVFFERKGINIRSSDVAMNAFEEDLTLYRAILRADVQIRDEEAFVNGVLTIDDASVTAAADSSTQTKSASEGTK